MARSALTHDERIEAARVQVRMLLKACDRFDDGDLDEALNVATRLRVLLHHKGTSHAALEPFGIFDHAWHVASGSDSFEDNYLPEHKLLRFGSLTHDSTAWEPRFGNFGVVPALPVQVQIRIMAHGRQKPRPGGRGRTFDDWWNQTVIRDAAREHFSRADLVLKMASQDGGSHVDPNIDARHHRLTRQNSLGISSGDTPKDSPVPASLRQIGWEVHSMLYEHLPHLLPDGVGAPRED